MQSILTIASSVIAAFMLLITNTGIFDGSGRVAEQRRVDNPGTLFRTNIGVNVNGGFSELQPIVSPDEQTLYFVRKGDTANIGYKVRPLDEDIWYSDRLPDGTWGKAQHMPPPLNTTSFDGIKAINQLGTRLYLQNVYNKDGSRSKGFSVSQLQPDRTWGFPEKLDIINYSNDTSLASLTISTDENVLVMSLKRGDTKGLQDLYVSFRMGKNTFTEPVNITELSTNGDEVSPFIGFDGHTLYFSSNSWGAGGGGLYDIFITRRLDDTWLHWSKPVKIPFPVNTASADFYFSMSSSGDTAYLSSWHETSTRGFGRADLWSCVVPPGFRPGELPSAGTKDGIDDGLVDGSELSGEPLTEGSLFRLENVFFDTDKSSLRQESMATLNKLVKVMMSRPSLVVELQGHTDNAASDDHNMDLSGRRARTVRDYLIKNGISADRLEAKGYGMSKPIAPNTTSAGKQLNRRVMVLVKRI